VIVTAVSVDLRTPADDSVASITGSERQTWWTPYESQGATAGFYYSLIGAGDRLSGDQPAGAARIRDGYNQWWDLGAGTSNNRTALPLNSGSFPNLIKLNIAGTNLMAQGESNAVTFAYQLAKPASSNAAIRMFLDDDFNPLNGNEQLVRESTASGTTSNNVGFGTVSINVAATNSTPGVHSLYAQITAGGRSRYLYAPELLTIFSSFAPPNLAIARSLASEVRIDVMGIPGQRIVLQSTADFRNWQPLATNWLTANIWTYFDTASSRQRFYKAKLQ